MPDTIAPIELSQIDGPQARVGCEQGARDDWSYVLTADDVTEIDAALLGVRDVDILDIDSAAFPLPTLSARLAEIKREILDGRGFFLFRGLPIAR